MSRTKSCGCAIAALTLSACGSDGGGTPVSSTPPPPASPASAALPSPLSAPATTASAAVFDTAEYRASNAAVGANLLPAWQAGASGKGIIIGFVDTGLNPADPEFSGRISPSSRDMISGRAMVDVYSHGNPVVSIAAGARDDSGMVGIAYNATIFMAKADEGCPAACNFPTSAIASGIDAARAAGAKVVNLSIGGNSAIGIEDAARRAAAAGMVIVIGAGNSGTEPSGMARRLAQILPDNVIIVGAYGGGEPWAVTFDGAAKYNAQAGTAMNNYLTAPGAFNTAKTSSGAVDYYSGTSFSAPVVAGAIALLAEAWPMLTAPQLVKLLELTADDIGAAGIDSVYGHGRLNLGKAFQPYGKAMVAGTRVAVTAGPLGEAPAASGDAVSRGVLDTLVIDEFGRAMPVNLAGTIRMAAKPGPLSALAGPVALRSGAGAGPFEFAITYTGRAGLKGGLASSWHEEQRSRLLAGMVMARVSGHTRLGFGTGSGLRQLSAGGSGQVGANSLTASEAVRAGIMSRPRWAMAAEQRTGRLTIAGGYESGDIADLRPKSDWQMSDRLSSDVHPRAYHRYEVRARQGDRQYVEVLAAILDERATLLGGRLNPLLHEGGAVTRSLGLSARQPLTGRWTAAATFQSSWTGAGHARLWSTSWAAEVSRTGLLVPGDDISLLVSQPLRIEKGTLGAMLPGSWDYAQQRAGNMWRQLSLSPSGREIAVEAGYSRNFGYTAISVHGFGRRQPGHVKSAAPDIGAAFSLSLGLR